MTYYIVGGSVSKDDPYYIGVFMDHNGYPDIEWGTKEFVRGDIIDNDPFWSIGLNTGVNPITRGHQQVEFGLFDNYRIKITTSGIYQWVGPGDDDFELIGAGGASNLVELNDVIITTPADNEVLTWDSTSSKWTNQTAAEAGLSTTGHNHDHNSLTNLNAGDSYEHITQTQKDALHDTYTDAMVDARIVVQNTDPAGTIDIAIDDLINTHNVGDNHVAHSGVTITAGTGLSGGGTIAANRTINCTITQYTDALVEAVITAELVGGQSIDNRIDALLTNNADGYVTQANTDALYSVLAHIHDGRYYTETEINANTYTRAQVDTAVATKDTKEEAHAYVEATALTLENDLVMGTHKITGVVDPVANQDAATKKYVDDNVVAGGASQAQILVNENVGVGNKKYDTLLLEGENTQTTIKWEISNAYRNYIVGNNYLTFGIHLPLSKVLFGTTYYLHIDRIRFGLDDADADDKVGSVNIGYWSDYTTFATHNSDATGWTTIAEHDVDFAVLDCNGKKRVHVMLYNNCATSRELEISYVRIRYYYDT